MTEYKVYVMHGTSHAGVPIFVWRAKQKDLPPEYRVLRDEFGGIALKYKDGWCKSTVQLEEAVQKMMARIKPQIKPGDHVEFVVGPAPGEEWEADEEGETLCFREYAPEDQQKAVEELIEKYKDW